MSSVVTHRPLYPSQEGSLQPAHRLAAVGVVIALHLLVGWALWKMVIRPVMQPEHVVQVSWVAPPQPTVEPPRPTPPKPQPKQPPKPAPVIAATPTPQPTPAAMVVAPDPTPAPAVESTAPPAPTATPAPPAPQPRTVSISELGLRVPAKPEWPRLSIKLGEQGRVLVRILVDTQGKVAQAFVQQSSGFERLDRAAVRAVERAELNPYMEGGRAVPAWAIYPVEFKLE